MVKTMWCRGIKMNFKFKTGFTLIELMVYIALLGGIVLIAGKAFSDSSKMRMRTQSMLQASEIAEKVAVIFKADVAQTGAKTSMEDGTSESGAEYGNKFSNIYTSV
jgi:prepilin-type N-terminal cleavage/methylation domain-containing protein